MTNRIISIRNIPRYKKEVLEENSMICMLPIEIELGAGIPKMPLVPLVKLTHDFSIKRINWPNANVMIKK
jgi:hypothetical protein